MLVATIRMPEESPPSLRAEWPYALALLAFFVAAAVAIGAHRDVPVIDDWTYAWSVEQLRYHGRLAMLDWSSIFPIGPALWGTAWSLVFGFSFTTLRISTLVLAAVASAALYLILRELEAAPRVALLGALTMAANPTVLLLSSSFMTDVPFVAFTLLALLCYVRASRRGDPRLLLWAGGWACLSCLWRQVGVSPRWRSCRGCSRHRTVACADPTWRPHWPPRGSCMAVGAVVVATWLPPTTEMDKLVDRLTWLLQVPIRNYFADNVYVATATAFYALPALLAMAAGRGLWRRWTLPATAVAVAALLLVVLGELPLPLRPRNTWTLREVGGPRQLISGAWPVMEWPWLESLLRVAGIVTMALALFALLPRTVGQRVAGPPGRTGPWASLARRATTALVDQVRSSRGPLVVYLAAYLVLVNVLWFYNDRYVLVLLPLVVALALGQRDQTLVPRLAWAALALFAVIGLAGTRDSLRFNQAVRDTWQSLVDSGVPPSDIDAGVRLVRLGAVRPS